MCKVHLKRLFCEVLVSISTRKAVQCCFTRQFCTLEIAIRMKCIIISTRAYVSLILFYLSAIRCPLWLVLSFLSRFLDDLGLPVPGSVTNFDPMGFLQL